MSPKDFRKICHPEVKILKSLVNCGHSDTQTDRQTVETRCRADPTPSGSAKNKDILKDLDTHSRLITVVKLTSINIRC